MGAGVEQLATALAKHKFARNGPSVNGGVANDLATTAPTHSDVLVVQAPVAQGGDREVAAPRRRIRPPRVEKNEFAVTNNFFVWPIAFFDAPNLLRLLSCRGGAH